MWFTKRPRSSIACTEKRRKEKYKDRTAKSYHHKRIDKVEKIMNSSSNSRTFAKLINQQSESNNNSVKAIIINGTVCDTPAAVCSGWATHFGNLAEPLQCEQFDQQYREVVHKGILAINKNVSEQILPTKLITMTELHNALKKLKHNKAVDVL